jgi:hypothetical protein
MAHSSFGSGWPNCQSSNMRTLARSDGVRISLHKDLVELVAILMDQTEKRGYNIRSGDTGAYNCRAIANTRTPSNHSWGTAIDINWNTNPRRGDRRFQSDMPRWMVDLWTAQNFRWGGRYSWPDAMHYEFMGSVNEARQRAANLRGKPATTGVRNLRLTSPMMRGSDVKDWQRILHGAGHLPKAGIDGEFGPKTETATKAFQRKIGVEADGVVGPATRKRTGDLLRMLAK